MRTKCIVFGEALRIRVKKFKQNLREIIQNAPKKLLQHTDFQNCFGSAYPRTQIGSAEKNTHEKNIEIIAPPPFLNFSLRHWYRGVGYRSDYSKQHAFATCDHSVIEQPCFHTYE